MKYLTRLSFLALSSLISFKSYSQVSLSTLQKLALLNSNNVYTLGNAISGILKPQGFKNIGGGKWVKANGNNGKEVISIGATFEGNQISYQSQNVPKSKSTVDAVRRLGNYLFNDSETTRSHFKNANKGLLYDVIYFNDYTQCVIGIVPYKEPEKKKEEKPTQQATSNADETLNFDQKDVITLTEFKLLNKRNTSKSLISSKGYKLTNGMLLGKWGDTIKIQPNKLEWVSKHSFSYGCSQVFKSLRKQINESDFQYSNTILKGYNSKRYRISENYYQEGGVGATFEVYTVYENDGVLYTGIIFNQSAEGED